MLDATVILKVETVNPIRSFKGRGADFLVSQANDRRAMICASAGNFGQAMAYACRKNKITLTVYASVNANSLKVLRMRELGARVILTGDDFDSAKREAKQAGQESGARFVEDSLDIETVEGAGTIGLELVNIPQTIDVLLISLGNGAMINGIGKVFKTHSPYTRIVAVQAAGAPAMVESWRANTLISHLQTHTIADGMAVRIPVPEALNDMKGIVDDAILVSDKALCKAMKLIHSHAGIVSEPSGAAGIAALIENPMMFSGKTVATIICGGNVTDIQWQTWVGSPR
jgi:threonine dehydratase